MILVSPLTHRGVGPSALSGVMNFFSPGWSHCEAIIIYSMSILSLPQEIIFFGAFLRLFWLLNLGSGVRSLADTYRLTAKTHHEIRLQVPNVHRGVT